MGGAVLQHDFADEAGAVEAARKTERHAAQLAGEEHPRALDLAGGVFDLRPAAFAVGFDLLEILVDLHAPLAVAGRGLPEAARIGRHHPQEDRALVALRGMRHGELDLLDPVGLPSGEHERVRDDPRAGPQLVEEERRELRHQPRQQVHRHHVRLREVGLQHVLDTELRTLGHAGGARRLAALLHELGVELEAEALRAEFPCRCDDDAAVARAEVDHGVGRAGVGDGKHPVDHVEGRSDKRGNLRAVDLRESD